MTPASYCDKSTTFLADLFANPFKKLSAVLPKDAIPFVADFPIDDATAPSFVELEFIEEPLLLFP